MKADRAGGVAWLLAALWAGLGAAGGGYAFFLSTQRLARNIGLPAWVGEPGVIYIAGTLAAAAWLVLTIPVLVAGFIRLRGSKPGRAEAWAGAWAVGPVLMCLVWYLQASPPGIFACDRTQGCGLTGYGPSAVSWPELSVCAAFLALGAVMTRIVAGPAQPLGVISPVGHGHWRS